MSGKTKCKVGGVWCKYCRKVGCTYTSGFPQYWETIKTCPKREKKRTISLKELLGKVTFSELLSSFSKYFPNQSKNIQGYLTVFEELKKIKPKKTNMELVAYVEHCDDGDTIGVYGLENGIEYSCSFTSWDKWLYMNITKKTLDEMPYADIVAGALYEMTYYGFTEERIKENLDALTEAIKEN